MIKKYEGFKQWRSRSQFPKKKASDEKASDENSWLFGDEFVYIKKRDGIISFGIRSSKYDCYTKQSMLLGSYRIIGTKYENDPKIRQIPTNTTYRPLKTEVNASTKSALIKHLLKEIGYDELTIIKRKRELLNKYYFLNIIIESNNLGELMNNLKEFKQQFMKEEEKHYDNWIFQKNITKYNL